MLLNSKTTLHVYKSRENISQILELVIHLK